MQLIRSTIDSSVNHFGLNYPRKRFKMDEESLSFGDPILFNFINTRKGRLILEECLQHAGSGVTSSL